MILKIEIRQNEMQEWNIKKGLDKEDSSEFYEMVETIVGNIVDVKDEFWDSYEGWFDRMITVVFEVESLSKVELQEIKENLCKKVEIFKIEKYD